VNGPSCYNFITLSTISKHYQPAHLLVTMKQVILLFLASTALALPLVSPRQPFNESPVSDPFVHGLDARGSEVEKLIVTVPEMNKAVGKAAEATL